MTKLARLLLAVVFLSIGHAAAWAQTIDVARHGAVGDGVRDDGGAIQAAIDAAPAGATVSFSKAGLYRIARALMVTKSLHFQGSAGVTIRQTRPAAPTFAVRASAVSFERLRFTGVQAAKWAVEEDAIHASGTFRPGRAPVYINDLKVTNCVFDRFGNAAIKVLYAQDVTVTGNMVTDVVNVGIGLLSVRNATVTRNTVRNVSGAGVTSRNAWGIYAVRQSDGAGDLVSQPRSENVTITDNDVSGVPTWTGIDTHGGNNITITGNRVRDTNFGIAVGTSIDRSGAQAYAPKGVTVANNILESGVSDGSRQYGISFTGVPAGELATGAIRDNTITGYGQSTSAVIPAINIGATGNLTVSGNTIHDPGTMGLYAVGPNVGLNISRNVIIDPWSNSDKVGSVMGIRIVGDRTAATIRDNSILRGGKAAKFTLDGNTGFGVYIGPGRGNSGRIGGNATQARKAIEDAERSLAPD